MAAAAANPITVSSSASERWPATGHVLTLSFLFFCAIAFGVWVVSAGKRYRAEYAQATEGWHVGGSRMVELTLLRSDRQDLACASDVVVAGLHCGHRGDLREAGPRSSDDANVLQPYNTIQHELLLAAGLWTSPALRDPLPEGRFSAVCNFHMTGVMKSASIRFGASAPFGPIGKTVAVGNLTDCMIPR